MDVYAKVLRRKLVVKSVVCEGGEKLMFGRSAGCTYLVYAPASRRPNVDIWKARGLSQRSEMVSLQQGRSIKKDL